jgi:hypothetical protein
MMRKDIKHYLNSSVITGIIIGALSIHAGAAEEPYSLINKKNLFSPDRKEWIMEKSDSKADDAKKMLPKLDPKQIQLTGTIIVGSTRKAIITNALKSMGKGAGSNAETYMVGDYLEGYLIKEIDEKKVVLNNSAAQEDIILFLHEGKTQRSTQKTELPAPAVETSPKEKKGYAPKKAQTGQDLMDRVKKTMNILRNDKSELVQKQAERDMQKLDNLMGSMSDEDRSEVVRLKKELSEMNKKK